MQNSIATVKIVLETRNYELVKVWLPRADVFATEL